MGNIIITMDIQKTVQEFRSVGRSREELYTYLLSQGVLVSDIQDAEVVGGGLGKFSAQDIAVRTVAVAGAIMVGLGILSFIASNWESFGNSGRVAIIFTGIAVSYLGAWFSYSRKLMVMYEACLLLANLIYGAGIFLINQMYNVDLDYLNIYSVWVIGTAGAYILTRSQILPWMIALVSLLVILTPTDFEFDFILNASLRASLIILPIFIVMIGWVSFMLENEDPKRDKYINY